MKIITKQFLKKHKACQDGIDYLFSLKDKSLFKPVNFINHCIKLDDKEKHQWANWLIVRCMNKKQKVQYAVFAAEQVLPLYENKYPDDNLSLIHI